jgi:Fic family protein
MSSAILYNRPDEMEPMLPSDSAGALLEKAGLLWRDSATLKGILPEPSRMAVADVVRSMNGYYSNLIEGHKTRPLDIEAALTRNFSNVPKERERQLLHYAHLETLRKAEESLTPETRVTSAEYLCWLHGEFFGHLPEEFLVVRTDDGKEHLVHPGRIRTENVAVGQHLAPAHESLGEMLERFDRAYRHEIRDSPSSLIAAAAAHHRLTWIHPFDDGNGRIARMLTHLWFIQAGAGGAGLWTLSRGLARNVDDYKSLLAGADEKRLSDFDGRGRMSDRKLFEFCVYLLDTARDQVDYMAKTLQIDTLADRLAAAVLYKEHSGELPKRSSKLVREALIKGRIARTEAATIMGVSPRTAQPVVQTLVKRGYLKSPSERGKLTVGFPTEICAFAFPELFLTGLP